MPQDNKPTPEELKTAEEEAIKAAEELEKNPDLMKDEDAEAEDIAKKEANPDEVIPPTTPDEKKEEDDEVIPVVEDPKTEQADPSKELYKKKFSESSREAQKIAAKNRVINKALIDAEEAPEPTEEELMAEYKDWDVMSETERGLAKETVISRNWRQTISKAKETTTKIEKWNDSVEEYIDDPKTLLDTPALEGKTDEFKAFAQRQENNSVPFNVLIGAFLYQHSTEVKPHIGKMFENGSGGPNDKPQPKTGKISLDQARQLRNTNYDKWKEMNSKGLIDFDV